MWSEISAAILVFLLLCASALAARRIRPHLPEHHREQETIDTMHLMVAMLVTFSALVLGQLLASAKTSYTNDEHDRQQYALELSQLDLCLTDYGTDAIPARAILRDYTAAVIISTWPTEPHPAGFAYLDTAGLPRTGESPALTTTLNQLYLTIRQLTPATAAQTATLQDCAANYQTALTGRIAVIEDASGSLSTPFYCILAFWLMIAFAVLGLAAPPNKLSLLGILLCAVSLSLAIFLISDLSHPYSGAFHIPSTTMRAALARMLPPPL